MKHGHVKTIKGKRRPSPEYIAWQGMKDRCNNKNNKFFHNYGGKGIHYHQSWNKFENFLKDIGIKPQKDLTLERIDSTKCYSKSNCKWDTRTNQSRNREYCKPITWCGKTLMSWEWAKELKVKLQTINTYVYKIKKGTKNEAAICCRL